MPFLDYASPALMFSQIVVLYWLVAPTSLRLMYRSYLNKNPGWVQANPAFAATRIKPAYPVALSLLIGLGWMVWLGRGLAGEANASWRVAALMLPMLVWLLLELAVAGIEYRRICNAIPLPGQRRASLERRSLRAYAHPAAIIPGLVLLVILCMAYVVGYCHDLIEGKLLAWRLLSIAIGTAIWSATLIHCIRRKPQPADEALGPLYRRTEVSGTIACLYLFVVAAGFRALQELCDMYLLNDVAFFSAASLVLQAALLFWISRTSVRKLLTGRP